MAKWISTGEASLKTGYTIVHIRRLLRSGEIAGQKWGRDWMVDLDSLTDYRKRVEAGEIRKGPKPRDKDK